MNRSLHVWMTSVLLMASVARAQETAEPESRAEPPHWPVGFKFPAEVVESWGDRRAAQIIARPAADVLVWTPPEAERIRAVLMFSNNTDLVRMGEHRALRQVAARHEAAIVYLRHFNQASFDVMLDLAAEKTGIAEFRHAPWITFGKSSTGRFSFEPAWRHPDRVVATISYHGEVPPYPMPDWSKAGQGESVMHLNVNGLSEWDGTWYRHVRPLLLNYHRHTGWLGHQMVIYGVDHSYYADYYLYPNFGQPMPRDHRIIRVTDVWDYIARFVDKALELRVPRDRYPTEEPVDLVNLRREDGYLIHPRAPEELLGTKWFAFRRAENGDYRVIPWPDEVTPVYDEEQGVLPLDRLILPASDVPEAERSAYMWVPDRELARAWLLLHNLYNQADRVLPPP